jgi:hypothetical protein
VRFAQVRACTPNVCTGTPPITFGSTNIVACTAPCTPKANGATISTGDNVLAFVKCNGPSYVRTPSELTSGAGSTPAPAVAVCAATGANGGALPSAIAGACPPRRTVSVCGII